MNLSQVVGLYVEVKPIKTVTKRGLRVAVASLQRVVADKPINEITFDDISEYRGKMDQLRATTYNSYLRQIRAIFNFARERDLCTAEHPAFALRKAREPKRPSPVVTEEFFVRAKALLVDEVHIHSNRLSPRWFWWTVLCVLTLTGMRRRQLCELRWRDIDFDRWMITLSRDGSKSGKEWIIPCPTALRPLLLDLRDRTQRAYGKVDPDAHLFRLEKWSPRPGHVRMKSLSPQYVTMRLRLLGELIGIHCSPHRLRHTAATRWASETGQIKAVRALLGHGPDAPTFDYLHASPESIRSMLGRL